MEAPAPAWEWTDLLAEMNVVADRLSPCYEGHSNIPLVREGEVLHTLLNLESAEKPKTVATPGKDAEELRCGWMPQEKLSAKAEPAVWPCRLTEALDTPAPRVSLPLLLQPRKSAVKTQLHLLPFPGEKKEERGRSSGFALQCESQECIRNGSWQSLPLSKDALLKFDSSLAAYCVFLLRLPCNTEE